MSHNNYEKARAYLHTYTLIWKTVALTARTPIHTYMIYEYCSH